MSFIDRIAASTLSPLARQFAVFCRMRDSDAGEETLLTAALVAERNVEGDTCLDLAAAAGKPLLADLEGNPLVRAKPLDEWKAALRASCLVGGPDDQALLVLDRDRLYLRRHWREECRIADALRARMTGAAHDAGKLRKRLDELFDAAAPGDPAQGQKLAAAMALTRRLCLITGGPGTGKTTTVTRILALLLENEPGLRILLAAPTGKAAARLAESIDGQVQALGGRIAPRVLERLPRAAGTVHRLLGWRGRGFARDAGNPLPCDCLVLDESSMVDQGLMAALLDALPEGGRLILLGDRDQLSSVEAGSVLGDLTGQGRALAVSPARAAELAPLVGELPEALVDDGVPPIADHIAQLRYSYRFASGGGIGRLAGAVNAGDAARVEEILGDGDLELEWIEARGRQPGGAIVARAASRYQALFDAGGAGEALASFDRSRVLCARADGPWGESTLRERIEGFLRQRGLVPREHDGAYRGLPILVRSNDRETGLFNGDTGILWPDGEGRLMAWFRVQGELTRFSIYQLPHWQPAWALTVHRSQGSEYDDVLLVLPPEESRVVSRELIYTGITRARRHCAITGSRERSLAAVGRTSTRSSGLAERMEWY